MELGEGIPNIVVATNRDAEHFEAFLKAWKDEFEGCHLIVCEDRQESTLDELISQYVKSFEVHDWTSIDEDLKESSWVISRKSSAIKSYGFYRAWQNKALFVVTLDDDVLPYEKGHIQMFYNKLFQPGPVTSPRFFSTYKNTHPRGTPTGEQVVGIVHGMWVGTPDFDAKNQLAHGPHYKSTVLDFNEGVVPDGALYSMCGMNLAFRTQLVPEMYFGLNGHYREAPGVLLRLPIDRCDDIWAGFWSKKFCDEKGLVVLTGKPYCVHTRASNPWTNLKKEKFAEFATLDFSYALTHGSPLLVRLGLKELVEYERLLRDAYKAWYALYDRTPPFAL